MILMQQLKATYIQVDLGSLMFWEEQSGMHGIRGKDSRKKAPNPYT